jgi:hypothetical protein
VLRQQTGIEQTLPALLAFFRGFASCSHQDRCLVSEK